MPEISSSKYLVMAGWDDVPHLTSQAKQELLDGTPPYLREARSKGIPRLGAGAIYPVAEDEIAIKDFEIPEVWPVAYAMDVGWKATAALWGAWDRQSDTIYVWSAYKQGQERPAVHADAIKSRGEWVPGVIDPASRGRQQADGKRLIDEYISLGLDVQPAVNTVEAGLMAVWRRLSSGRLKVFASLGSFFDEYRIYRRDDNGKIVKENDHLMDCLRYLVMSGMGLAVTYYDTDEYTEYAVNSHREGHNATTGY